MQKGQINPTRMELTRLKRKLATALRGHKLLKDKRDELMRQFLELARVNRALRAEVEAGLSTAAVDFALARATTPPQLVDTALLAPAQEVEIDVGTRNVMSVDVPTFSCRFLSQDSGALYAYGLGFTSSDLDDAVGSLSRVFKDMLRLAEVEKSCQLMAAEIEKTRRRVNALEYVLIPEMRANIRYITMKLDENERGVQIRLMKVKSMILEQAHHYAERRQGQTENP